MRYIKLNTTNHLIVKKRICVHKTTMFTLSYYKYTIIKHIIMFEHKSNLNNYN